MQREHTQGLGAEGGGIHLLNGDDSLVGSKASAKAGLFDECQILLG